MEDIHENEEGIICYFNDIRVFSKDDTTHEKYLNRVLNKWVRLKLNLGKLKLQQKDIEFFACCISNNGVKPEQSNMDAILLYILVYHVTFWDLNWDFLLLEIICIPVGLNLSLVKYLHKICILCMMQLPNIKLKFRSQKVMWYASIYGKYAES